MSETEKTEMLAAVLRAPGDLRLERRPVPVAQRGEILLRIEGNTLCGTDGRLLTGEKTAGVKPGVIPGHEFVGRIAAIGEGVSGYEVGKQAVVSIVVSCGSCPECQADMEEVCDNLQLIGYGIDGGLAEYCLIPAGAVSRGNVVQIENDLPPAALSLIEPISCCLHGLNRYRVDPGDTVVIFGAGPIGLIHVQLAKISGATQIIVSNRSEARRELARELGATRTLDPREESVADVVRRATAGRGADVAVVCVGVPELANEALQVVRVGGRVNFFAGFPKGSTATIDPNLIHYNELTVTGGSNAARREVKQAVELVQKGLIDAEALVSHTFSLEDVEEAYKTLMAREGLKVLVVP